MSSGKSALNYGEDTLKIIMCCLTFRQNLTTAVDDSSWSWTVKKVFKFTILKVRVGTILQYESAC